MFTLDDIRSCFDPRDVERGLAAVQAGLVLSVVLQADGQGGYAAVRNESGRTVRCQLRWQRAGGRWRLQGSCSCLRRNACRHVVAALIRIAEDAPAGDPVAPALPALQLAEAAPASEGPNHMPDALPPPVLASALEAPGEPQSDAPEPAEAEVEAAAPVALRAAEPAAPAVVAAPKPVAPRAPTRGPRPVLRLLRLEGKGPGGERVRDFAQLLFDYRGARCSYDERAEAFQRGDGESQRRVLRNREAELRARDRLRALGLLPSDPARPALLRPLHERDWFPLMLEHLPRLESEGWSIEIDHDFTFRLHEPAPDWALRFDEERGRDWFGLSLDIEIEGERLPLLPMLAAFLRHQAWTPHKFETLADDAPLVLRDEEGRRWIRVTAGRLKPILATLLELFERPQFAHDGRLWLPRVAAAQLGELAQTPQLRFEGQGALRQMAQQLREGGIPEVLPPQGLRAELRGYQREGLSWLQFLRAQNLGGVLADDMGLGKTLQTLAHLLIEKESGRMDRPTLVIAPTSLMFNWRHEAARFTPALRVLVLQGNERHTRFQWIDQHDVVLTTYPLLPRDFEALSKYSWHYVILDEAQNIKNSRSRAAQLVRQLRARHRLCLTGTPMENHLGELWSLMHFLMPGLLGDEMSFKRRYRIPIEKHGEDYPRLQLKRRTRPFLLRRTKSEVAKELPPRTDILRTVMLEGAQRELYETLRVSMQEKLRAEIAARGLSGSRIAVLDALLKLRQVCCDPRLVKLDGTESIRESAKLDLLMDLLPEMIEEGRRVLLFSQFTSMLALIEERLHEAQLEYVILTGDTRDRQGVVERFQKGQVPLFLISLKAGGVGLNLTAADTVIHYDPWWNPAVEQQATDRAHRIGQDKPVFVYKLLTEGTVEQRIADMQDRKRELAESLLSETGSTAAWTEEDIESLFAPL